MAQRIDMHIPSWDGKAESLEDYAIAVELLVLGTPLDARPLLGPRLVAALPSGSPQQKFALRLPRDATMKDGMPEDPKSIAIPAGPSNLVEAFKKDLGVHVVSDIGERTDNYFYAGQHRTALTRKLGQSMAQWIETEQEAYAQLLRAYKSVSPQLLDILPDEVRGVLLWRNVNLTPTERSAIGTAIAGKWELDHVRRQLRSSWTAGDLAQRDKQYSRSARGSNYAE